MLFKALNLSISIETIYLLSEGLCKYKAPFSLNNTSFPREVIGSI